MSETYTVQEGDSFLSVAQSYGMTIYDIAKYNKLESFKVSVGQVLKIPSQWEIALSDPRVLISGGLALVSLFILISRKGRGNATSNYNV